jgi:hypothetical protein
MNSNSAVMQNLQKPIEVLFVVGNGLVWLVFCTVLVLRWNVIPASSKWQAAALAISFALLGYSLIAEDNKSSRLLCATASFLATMMIAYRLF